MPDGPALSLDQLAGRVVRFEGLSEPRVPDSPTSQTAPATSIRATPFSLRNPANIPRRRWLYGRRLVRGFISTTVAPGGVGKTSLVIVEALSMVSGRKL